MLNEQWFENLTFLDYGRKMFQKNSCRLHKIKRHGILANVATKLLTLVIWPIFGFLFFLCLSIPLSPKALCWKISLKKLIQFSSVQSLSRVRFFATPWIAARQASLSITSSRSSLRFTSIESVMPSSHLILSSPSPPAPNPSQHQGLFQWVNSSHEVAKVPEFQP